MTKRESRWSLSLFILLCAGCLGAQLIQVPKKSDYAPKDHIAPAGMVRYPIAPMSGTTRQAVTPDYPIKHREAAFKAMYDTCEGPDYEIIREEEVVLVGEAVWINLHFLCNAGTDAGIVAAAPDGGV